MRRLTQYLWVASVWAVSMTPVGAAAQSNSPQNLLPGGQAPANQQLNDVLQQLQQKDGMISSLQSQLTKQDDVVGGLAQQLSSQKGLVGSLQDRLSKQGSVLSVLQAQLGEKDGLLSALQSQLSDTDGLLASVTSQLGEKEGVLSAIQAQLDEKDNLLSSLKDQLAERAGLVSDLSGELASATSLAADLRSELGKRKGEANALLARVGDLSAQVATARQTLAVKDRVIGEVQGKFARVSEQLNQAIDERGELGGQLERAEKKLATLRKGLRATERLANQRATELESATDSLRQRERKLKAAAETAEGLATQRLVLVALLGLAVIGLLWGWLRRPKARGSAEAA